MNNGDKPIKSGDVDDRAERLDEILKQTSAKLPEVVETNDKKEIKLEPHHLDQIENGLVVPNFGTVYRFKNESTKTTEYYALVKTHDTQRFITCTYVSIDGLGALTVNYNSNDMALSTKFIGTLLKGIANTTDAKAIVNYVSNKFLTTHHEKYSAGQLHLLVNHILREATKIQTLGNSASISVLGYYYANAKNNSLLIDLGNWTNYKRYGFIKMLAIIWSRWNCCGLTNGTIDIDDIDLTQTHNVYDKMHITRGVLH